MRWTALQQCELSGPIRAFLFRLTHRRLPIRSMEWLARHYGSSSCIMCQSGEKETYSHLFSECRVAGRLWRVTQPIMSKLQMGEGVDLRPTRLVGDLGPATIERFTEYWPDQLPKPGSDTIWHWMRICWTELRATVLHSIWAARCSLLAEGGDIATPEEAEQYATQQMLHLIRTLVYRKLPSLLPGLLQTKAAPRLHFYQQTWGLLATGIMLPRHQPTSEEE